MKKIIIDSAIFRDYDIRGIYPGQINESTFYVLGRSISMYLKAKEVAVGYDTRLSSKSLFDALVAGLTVQGVNVVNLGLISTEINYFACGKYNFAAAIIVSASHNPPQYNGLKIVEKGVVPLHGQYGLPQIKKYSLRQDFPKASKQGTVSKKSVLNPWITHVLSFINKKSLKPLKVVIDAGNGMGGISWNKIIGQLPFEIIPLFFAPDGHFPNHLPDPLNEKNLSHLKNKIRKTNADVGFAIDGDADRIFVVDNLGHLLSGTVTSAMLSAHLLQKYGPATVMYSAVCGKIVSETIRNYQGKAIRVRVGHSYIKEKMKQLNALFAGEHSGHFYFRDNFYADSSTIAGLYFLEYLSTNNKKLSTLRIPFDKYISSGEINFKVKNTDKTMKIIANKFSDAKIDYLDGLSARYGNWWFNFRPSKTEPLLRLNVEADDRKMLNYQIKRIKAIINSIKS